MYGTVRTVVWELGVGDCPWLPDLVVGFQHRNDAVRFLSELRERLLSYKLELHPDKTRLLEFGRFADENRQRRGAGKPETFDFLGFTLSLLIIHPGLSEG